MAQKGKEVIGILRNRVANYNRVVERQCTRHETVYSKAYLKTETK